jgi:hypothetical protein
LCVTSSSSRERKREERRGGMRKADLNKLVKAGHLTYFSSFFLLCFAIGPSPTVWFSNFFFYFILFYFLTGGDWDVKIRQADSQRVAKTPHRRTRFACQSSTVFPSL